MSSTGFPRFWAALRLMMAIVVVAATVEQTRLAIEVASAAGLSASFAIGRLFTFFTVLSNVWLVIMFSLAGLRVFARREGQEPHWLSVLLASMSAYMLVTGIVYNVVLRAVGDADIMGGWSNTVHHVIGPVFVLLDVLIAPRPGPLRWRDVPAGLVFPILWVCFTMATGPFRVSPATDAVPWYPYPFLNPAAVGGYGAVLLWVGGISLMFAALLIGIVAVKRIRLRKNRLSAKPALLHAPADV